MPRKKPKRKSQNPIGPIDKPRNTKTAGLTDDTRVVYAEERNQDDG
jgi:hypothetical protein